MVMAERNDLRIHRSWEDWLGIGLGIIGLGLTGLGLIIICAPWVVDDTRNVPLVANATLTGSAVVLLAELDLVQFRRWPQVGQLACGVWAAMSSIVFGYSGSGSLRVWHLAAGFAVALLGALEIWQRRDAAK